MTLFIFAIVIVAVAVGVYLAVNAAGVKLTREHLKDNPEARPDDMTRKDVDQAIDIEY